MIFLYLFLTLLMLAFFSGIEIGFNNSNKLNIEIKKKQGFFSGKILSKFKEKPEEFLGTSFMGTNIVLIIFCFFILQLILPFTEKYFGNFAKNMALVLFCLILISWFLVLLFGELFPKAIFKSRGDKLLSVLSLPILFFYKLLYPFVSFFVGISEWVLKYLFSVKSQKTMPVFSKLDLENFVKKLKSGKDDEHQDLNSELFENALALSNVKIRECLIPRNEIIAVKKTASVAEIKQLFIDTKLSKIIIYDKDMDDIIGYVHHLDFYKKNENIDQLINTILAVPETMNAVQLLNNFSKQRKSIAWVLDEFGGTAGIVTMEDILEEIFGEIHDEHDEMEYVEKQISKNEFLFSGRLEVEYINKKYELEIPTDDAETLSGFIIENYNEIPMQKEKIIIDNFEFDILLISDTRIETVKLKVLDKS
jgi:putative hemolysin